MDVNEILLSQIRQTYVKIEVLSYQEKVLGSVEGEVISGNMAIDGDSNVRRVANLVFVATTDNYKVLQANNKLSINKKIKIYIGIKSDKTDYSIYYFKLGTFLLTGCNVSVTTTAHTISITAQDKMCLHNGTVSGVINYNTRVDVETISQPYQEALKSIQTLTSEIQTLLDENRTKPEGLDEKFALIKTHLKSIFEYAVNVDYVQETLIFTLMSSCDSIPILEDYKQIKSQFKTFSSNITKLSNNSQYKKLLIKDIIKYAAVELAGEKPGRVVINDVPDKVKTPIQIDNETIGFKMIDYVYPTELVISTGQPVTAIYDACKQALGGNYEYFYDIDGNFIFQEIKNYQYNNIVPLNELRPENYKISYKKIAIQYDFSKNGTITSYTNTPQYANIKNDFYVWGTGKDYLIGYHLVIDSKPFVPKYVKDFTSENGTLLPNEEILFDWKEYIIHNYNCGVNWNFVGKGTEANLESLLEIANSNKISNAACCICLDNSYEYRYLVNGTWQSVSSEIDVSKATIIPDYYEELATIYYNDRYNPNFTLKTNNIPTYNFDIIEGDKDLTQYSIKRIGKRTKVTSDQNIKQLYPTEVQEILVYKDDSDLEYTTMPGDAIKIESSADFEKYPPVGNIYKDAFSTIKDMLWNYTLYNEQITLVSIPIYYLEVNRRNYVYNKAASINGYYLSKKINFNFNDAGLMTITMVSTNDRMATQIVKNVITNEDDLGILTHSNKYLQTES